MTIYYFSGTGNSYFVSKIIAQKINENVQIVPIGYAYKNALFNTNEESIGFIYPSYAYGLPKIVRQFVKKLNIKCAEYVFSIVTYGSKPGSVHGGLNRLLKKKKIKLNYAAGIKSVENFVPMFKMADEEKTKILIEHTENAAGEIAEDIKNRVQNKFKIRFILMPLISGIFNVFATKLLPKFFRVKGCNACGLCKRVCPMFNIDIIKNKPKFKRNCNVCTACMQACPKKAIRLLRATKNSKRYFNSKVDFAELNKITDFCKAEEINELAG